MNGLVKFGVCMFPTQFIFPETETSESVRAVFGAAQLAEKCGLDSYWVIDHLLTATGRYRNPVLEPLTLLTALSARTQRIRLGTSILILPLRDPVVTAKQLATMDVLSGGRIIVGAAAGWAKEEFDASGIPFESRGKRFDEQLTVIKKLWTEDDVTFTGDHFSLSKVTVDPKPVQRPHMPIWIGAENVAINAPFRRVAQFGDGWLGVTSPRHYGEGLSKIATFAGTFGRDPSTIEHANFTYTMVDEDSETARRKGLQALAKIHSEPIMENVQKLLVAGSPSEVADKIENQIRAGVRYIILNLVTSDPDVIALVAEKVIPNVDIDVAVKAG